MESRSAPTSEAQFGEVAKLQRRMEAQEKALISNNIVIKGLVRGALPAIEAVENFIHEEFGLINAVADVRELDRYFNNLKILIVKLNGRAIKDDIMKQKSKLGQRKVYIEHELSSVEQEIYKAVKARAKELRDQGKTVKIC